MLDITFLKTKNWYTSQHLGGNRRGCMTKYLSHHSMKKTEELILLQ